MRALQYTAYGGPEVLEWAQAPDHHAGPGQLRIAVRAASVNPIDWKAFSGAMSGGEPMAGTGYLGEVTCDGTRDVGLFWRDALGWPLVWDRDGETAVQSPLGGTKISWDLWGGGPPVERKNGRNRQSFDLVTDDPAREAERLVSLGATRLSDLPDGIELADPDRNEFRLRTA